MNRTSGTFLVAAIVTGLPVGLIITTRTAAACTGPQPAKQSAFPSAGAQEVSPLTSIVFTTGSFQIPVGLNLMVNGLKTPLPAILPLGGGLQGSAPTNYWELNTALEPSSDYILSVDDQSGTHELTHFSTAATYEKVLGTAPKINRLRLWRVRYPVSKIGAGGCVFSEFEGYFDIDFAPASVPGTPPKEVISVLRLAPQNGGASQELVFTGLTTLPGGFMTTPPIGDGVELPNGEGLAAYAALWKLELQPDRVYCGMISSFGRNDRAALPQYSDQVCVTVTSLNANGVTVPDSAGCPIDAGANSDVGENAAVAPAASKGGCSIAGAGTGDESLLLFIANLSALFLAAGIRRTARGSRVAARC